MSIEIGVVEDADLVRGRLDALAAVYRAAFGAPGYDEGEEEVRRFLEEQLPRHIERDGFRLAQATADGVVVGFAYGYTGQRGQWWTDRVATLAPAEVVEEWLGGHFELVELAVDPVVQRGGVGARLHDELLAGLPHERALLSTYRDDRAAPRLYRRLGWQLLVPDLDEDNALYGLHLAARSAR
ncbi:MAG TPA: GNAT family N-acetyltransferase [Nocardioidaceae bacterium]|nr:GNAT family N-acetyltransferase [Nocardioidaceae bacterium]